MSDIEAALKNITGIRFVNIATHPNTTVLPSPAPHQCSVFFEVMAEPKFVYHDLGEFLVAYDEMTGFMHAYHYMKGTKDGFAGAKIEVPVWGGSVFSKKGKTKRIHQGSLWDSVAAQKACDDYFGFESVPVGCQRRFRDAAFSAAIRKDVFVQKLNATGFINLNDEGYPDQATVPVEPSEDMKLIGGAEIGFRFDDVPVVECQNLARAIYRDMIHVAREQRHEIGAE